MLVIVFVIWLAGSPFRVAQRFPVDPAPIALLVFVGGAEPRAVHFSQSRNPLFGQIEDKLFLGVAGDDSQISAQLFTALLCVVPGQYLGEEFVGVSLESRG